ARNRLIGQRADCDVLVKNLVYLSGEDEPALRQALESRRSQLPLAAALTVAELPAAVLAQRPDLAAAERELAAASAEIGVAEANRYPRISLTGTIGRQYFRFLDRTNIGSSWGFGPALTLPIFDAGRRTAQADVARTRFAELRATYMQRARSAVREVEEALVRLDSAERREADGQAAVRDFEVFLAAAESRWKVGVGNLLELEEARRQALNANSALLQIRRERVAQWINLYKALGGGWHDQAVVTAPTEK
ncbi:MAG: TolC family protein, partial [Burkholderiales bacterium]